MQNTNNHETQHTELKTAIQQAVSTWIENPEEPFEYEHILPFIPDTEFNNVTFGELQNHLKLAAAVGVKLGVVATVETFMTYACETENSEENSEDV